MLIALIPQIDCSTDQPRRNRPATYPTEFRVTASEFDWKNGV